MIKDALQTPAIILDLNKFENNLRTYQEAADKHGKQIWPMIKTHKSTEMAKIQKQTGVTGFLCGTLDECEKLCDAGLNHIMYAYPVASEPSISRVIALSKKCDFIIRADDPDGAKLLNDAAAKAGVTVNYTIIVDSGLHRFGVEVSQVVAFADKMKELKHLVLKGISTHPGHVYGCTSAKDVPAVVSDEKNTMKAAADALRAAGYKLDMVTSGSTPTFFDALDDENISVYHPGNYVFLDVIQMSIDRAKEDDCALTVLASVISHPKEDLYITDAGAKCLGLDQGAHANNSIKGFGYVKGHPELTVYSLSEEVGKLHVEGKTNLKVGDKIEIIPNHSCSTANLTNYYIGCRGDQVERIIPVDIRGNSTMKQAK
jgi:D-serine deaminase-like pyridoxal phosphate-dependent protein